MVVKSLAQKPHLSPAFWGITYLHNIDILNIIPTSTNVSIYFFLFSRPFDLEKTPLLPFGSIVAAHRPLASQTALSGRSIESIFVGIAHDFAGRIISFNPISNDTNVQHSFKYLSDIDPISTSYFVFDDSSPSPTPAEPISYHLNNLDHIIEIGIFTYR